MRTRSGVAAAGLFLGATVVALGAAELSLRAYAASGAQLGDQLRAFDPLGVQIEPYGQFGYRQRPGATIHYANGTVATSNELRFRGPAVALQKPLATLRVILLGGSTTHGWGVDDSATIDAYLRTVLRSRIPGTHVEVVNLAFDGYDSLQLLERLRGDGLRLAPDLLVLNTGINDVRNARFPGLREHDPRTLIWESDLARLREEQRRGGPAAWTRLKHLSYVARMPGFVREQLRRAGELAPVMSPQPGTGVRQAGAAAIGPPYPEAATLFERHVRQMVELASARGIAVLLSTPPSALRDLPPDTTSAQGYWVVNARTTQRYRDTLEGRLRTIASDARRHGEQVRHVAFRLPRSAFIDDCHLTPAGNRMLATALADSIVSMLAPRAGLELRGATRRNE